MKITVNLKHVTDTTDLSIAVAEGLDALIEKQGLDVTVRAEWERNLIADYLADMRGLATAARIGAASIPAACFALKLMEKELHKACRKVDKANAAENSLRALRRQLGSQKVI